MVSTPAPRAALTAQADDLEPNIGLHWYLAAQLHGAQAPGLQGLRGPTRALLHALAGARLGCACSTPDCPDSEVHPLHSGANSCLGGYH